jgi:predicted AlkP superfamily pyrophosphatase or phosphodiesterase
VLLAMVGTLLLLPVTPSSGRPQTSPAGARRSGPKLVVLIVVDQMRADYVERFQRDWTSGLKRLVTEGAWFSNAAYPYLGTYTCAGHATVSTGAFPRLHGIFQNTWYDRDTQTVIPCTNDTSAAGVAYGVRGRNNEGPARLLVPSFADEMRTQRSARVVSLALKARSAIMLAGHGGDAVTWISDSLDGWQTSKAFAPSPVAAVQTFVAANPIDADFPQVWDRLLPAAAYHEIDAGNGEAPPVGWTNVFPHPLKGERNQPDERFRQRWQDSPFADAYIGRFAAALAEALQLGKHETTDVLAVSFSSPDLVGHAFGPRSHEVQDVYAHLDRTLGALFERLDALVGRDEYVVALSADHGVADIPEQITARGGSAGRLTASAVAGIIERTAQAALGPGKYVARVNGSDVYFEPDVYERLRTRAGALDAVVGALEQQPGIARVFRSGQLTGTAAANSNDPILRAAALSFVPRRSGDLVLVTKPGWMFSVKGTTHGSVNPYDQRVPVIFMGAGIKRGHYTEALTPADIAPTLAALCGITMPRAEGRPIHAILPAAALASDSSR